MKKTIPFRNYIILGLISCITFILIYCFVSFYNKQIEYKNSIDARMRFLSEVKENEIRNYILDNHDVIIYVSNSTDNSYCAFEKQLKTLMLEENLTKDVVYLDMYKTSEEFVTKLQKDLFASNLKLNHFVYPNILIVTDGKINSVLYATDQRRNPKEMIQYIKEHLDNE